MDDNYQLAVPQPGATGGATKPPVDNPTSRPANQVVQEPGSSSDSSEDEGQEQDQFQTALDTILNNPALSQYIMLAQEIQLTQPLNLDNNLETGLGRLNSVI